MNVKKLKGKRSFISLFWNCFCFWGSGLLVSESRAGSLWTAFDAKIPVIPWTILIYFGSYLFWAVIYYDRLKTGGRDSDRFFHADLLAKAVCVLFFLLMPTTIVRPAADGAGFWNAALRLLYSVDRPINLFPSIHCVNSWLCWIAMRGRNDRGKLAKLLTLAMALAICVSTLTVRQHVIADVLGGILLAELCYLVCGVFLKKS